MEKFNSAEQGNNEKYCSRKESQDYSSKGQCHLHVEVKEELNQEHFGVHWEFALQKSGKQD